MNNVLCPNNHYYDKDANPTCPHCAAMGAVGLTMPLAGGGGEIGATMPLGGGGEIGATMPLGGGEAGAGRTQPNFAAPRSDEGQTVIDIKERIGIDPVVGWLVCVEGTDRGRDYRMHADNNYIGRAENMDIVIRNDDTISRVNHAVVTYDMRENIYYFAQGGGRGVVRLNGKPVFNAAELKAYDRIEIGNTKLVFVPLCGEGFDWNEE